LISVIGLDQRSFDCGQPPALSEKYKKKAAFENKDGWRRENG